LPPADRAEGDRLPGVACRDAGSSSTTRMLSGGFSHAPDKLPPPLPPPLPKPWWMTSSGPTLLWRRWTRCVPFVPRDSSPCRRSMRTSRTGESRPCVSRQADCL